MSYIPDLEGYNVASIDGGGATPTEYLVTNLNDSGAGSLREALEASGARYVSFEGLSGDITLNSYIDLNNDDITVDFRTAADKGIQLKAGSTITQAPIRVSASNVIIRGLKSRPGIDTNDNVDAIQCNGADGVLFDHCDFMFSSDENANPWDASTNIIFQWCIFAYPLNYNTHGLNLLVGNNSTNVSLYRCLLAHSQGRNPRLASAGPIDMRNCIIYNCIDHPITTSSAAQINLIGNVLVNGPDSTRDYFITTNEAVSGGSIYHSDNIYPSGGSVIRPDAASKFTVEGSPISPPATTPHTIPAKYVLSLLPYMGATQPVRDALTQEVIDDVIAGTGTVIDAVAEVGYPTLDTITYEYKLISVLNVTGKDLIRFRVEFYNSSSLVHTQDFLTRLPITRTWSNGETGSIRKWQAMRDILDKFVEDHSADRLVAPETSDLSTLATDTTDTYGWLSDTEILADIDTLRPIV